MAKAPEITGKKFKSLTAAWPAGIVKRRQHVWLFFCDCGNFKAIRVAEVRSSKTVSCGCIRAEIAGDTATRPTLPLVPNIVHGAA